MAKKVLEIKVKLKALIRRTRDKRTLTAVVFSQIGNPYRYELALLLKLLGFREEKRSSLKEFGK